MPHLRNQVLGLLAINPATAQLIQQQLNATNSTTVTIASVYKALSFWADQGMIDVSSADYTTALTKFDHLGSPDLFAATEALDTTPSNTAGTNSIVFRLTGTGKQLLAISRRSHR